MGTLYIVSTPIGNLEDITLRALRALTEVDVILCEDTRTTKHLLDHHAIADKKLSAYNEQRSGVSAQKVIDMLAEEKDVALVSDAGTPGISDPGVVLVRDIRQQEPEANIAVIPGPSAVVAALSGAGVPTAQFTYLGFLPHKKGRETLFTEIAESSRTVVFYESPHRIMKTLSSLNAHCPERTVVLARELTKIHEEFLRGTPEELTHVLETDPQKQKGEFVVLVSPV